MSTLIIAAAGAHTRLGGSEPKALTPINGEPNIVNTVRLLHPYFKNILIVGHEEHHSHWANCPIMLPDVHLLLEEGARRGDGQTVRLALDELATFHRAGRNIPRENIVITWGDAVFSDAALVRELQLTDWVDEDCSGVFPVVHRKRPYVRFLPGAGEPVVGYEHSHDVLMGLEPGWQDLCLFKFRHGVLLNALNNLDFTKENYSVLDTFSWFHSKGRPARCYETPYGDQVKSFNTHEELKEITK